MRIGTLNYFLIMNVEKLPFLLGASNNGKLYDSDELRVTSQDAFA